MFILIGLLLLAPTYYVLKAKGYRAPFFLWPAVLATALSYGAWMVLDSENTWMLQNSPAFAMTLFAPGIVVLALSWILPTRKGAPGLSYLHIEFTCPHCKRTVKFGREREGFAELCPLCEEIVTVPTGLKPFQPPPIPKSLQTQKDNPAKLNQ